MLDADWSNRTFDFYTVDGAIALAETLNQW